MADPHDASQKTVLVFGASGFVGSKLIAALGSDPALRPIATSRRAISSIETRVCDATDAASVKSVMRDIDYVVNCVAGRPGTMIAAMRNICDAGRLRPPVRIVHLSSMAVYGSATGIVSENQAPVAPLSAYGRAKVTCEHIVRQYVQDGGDAVILRPTCVFGPGSPQWTTRIARLLAARRLGDLGPAGDGWCNLAFIDDLTSAIIEALAAPQVTGKAYNISSSSILTWNQFLLRFGISLGATPIRRIPQRMLKLETKVLAAVRRSADIGLRRVGLESPMTEAITPSLLALMGQDIRIDCSAAVSALSLPQTSAETMIALAADWFMRETSQKAVGGSQLEAAGL